MPAPFNIILLAYPDNPAGSFFLQTFFDAELSVMGIVVERKLRSHNLQRFVQKIKKDGFAETLKRILQMIRLRVTRKRIIDLAAARQIPVYTFPDMNSRACADLLESLKPDLLVVASAPILKSRIFSKAKYGCLNPHPGWLPKYRGLGANAYAIQQNDKPGITIHFIDEGIDTGKIIVREQLKILKHDTIATINDRAMARGAELMVRVIRDIQFDQLNFQIIDEPKGQLYPAMPYQDARILNKKLRTMGEKS